MIFRRVSFALFLSIFWLLSAGSLRAQDGIRGLLKPVSAQAGATVSVFNPDYVKTQLIGVGAFADMTTAYHGCGLEAEGRWQRFHENAGVSEDNYLIGPRLTLRRFWNATPYIKMLGGVSHIDFGKGAPSGRFATIAVGGGIDVALTPKWSLRAVDFEYQEWPGFIGNALSPYGVSAGVRYRFF